MPKRGDRVAPPPAAGGWDLRFGDAAAVDGWDQLCRQAPGPTLAAWTTLRTDPRRRSERQHPLKGELGIRSIGGRMLDQWQLEVTGAGRIWYAIDDERRVVVLTLASVGHPARTD
ncbi:MAG: hypothetical protein A2Z32_00420 [Chloroflexi bacterium RBG_16_69_14]|nr:MAG: hypothetical protein A2Z32_00420 [Chloroflexi bacterium RBG_16_69_14]